MTFIPSNPDRVPQTWGIPSEVQREQTSVPDGPHVWGRDGILTECTKCGIAVLVGSADEARSLRRLAGTLCSDVLASDVMSS